MIREDVTTGNLCVPHKTQYLHYQLGESNPSFANKIN
jgi:hypothetical protein